MTDLSKSILDEKLELVTGQMNAADLLVTRLTTWIQVVQKGRKGVMPTITADQLTVYSQQDVNIMVYFTKRGFEDVLQGKVDGTITGMKMPRTEPGRTELLLYLKGALQGAEELRDQHVSALKRLLRERRDDSLRKGRSQSPAAQDAHTKVYGPTNSGGGAGVPHAHTRETGKDRDADISVTEDEERTSRELDGGQHSPV